MLLARAQRGFTLLELLVALTVVIILTLVAIPSLTNFFQEYRVTASTQQLYYVLQYARSEAIKRDTSVYVSFQTGDSWCYGVNTGSACSCNVANSCGLGTYTAPQSQQLTLSTTTLTNSSVSFEGTRGASGAASTITYTVYGNTTAIGIDITALGNMQMCSSQVSGYSPC